MHKKAHHLSILFVPDDNSRSFQLRMRISLLKVIAGFLLVCCLLITIGVVSYWKVAVMALSTKKVLKRNAELELECQKVNELAAILKRTAEADQQIRKIAGGIAKPKTATSTYPATYSDAELEKTIQARLSQELAPRTGTAVPESRADVRPLVHSTSCNFAWPIYGGWITNEFTMDKAVEKKHQGIDIAAKVGTPVKAASNGVVSFSGWSSDFGNLLIIDHGNGFLTRYGHNSRVVVEKGDIVKQGRIIAFAGNSGRSSAPHLHFEIWKDGVPVNPRDYLLR